MKRFFPGISIAVAAACGGSNGGGSKNTLAGFEGAAWNAAVTDTASCPSPFGTRSAPRNYSITFLPGTGADLQFTSAEGCLFKFNVSSYTATLVNAPVSCTVTLSGITGTVTWNTFTATTTDGHNLTTNGSGSATNGSVTCSFTETGTATR